MTRFHTLLLCALAALAPAMLSAQGVLVAPTGIFINPQTRGATVELYNPGLAPVEVSISTEFGYPVSEPSGKIILHMDAAPDSTLPSAARWVDAYPRRLVMRPRERQTVRLFARPPANLADGEYWSRLIVDAKGGQVAVQSSADSASIHVGLTLEVRTIVAVFYRKGRVSSGLTMADPRARAVHDSVQLCTHLTRTGNAAFLGTLHTTLVDSAGAQRAVLSTPLAVYYTMSPCVAIPDPPLTPGRYVLHLLVDTDRDDLQRATLLPFAPLRDSVVLNVPPTSR